MIQYLSRKSMYSRKLLSFIFNLIGLFEVKRRKSAAKSLSTDLTSEETTKLHKNGFISFSKDQRFNFLESAINEANSIIDNNSNFTTKDKSYMKSDFVNTESLGADSVLVKLATDKRILSIAAEYFGYLPVLSNISVIQSKNITNANDLKSHELTSSQLFHLDHADVKQLKLFIYCNDVTKESGPFSLIGLKESTKLISKINYALTPDKYRVSDEKVQKHLPEVKTVQFVKPKGTIIFADTSRCFHFGSRVEAGAHERRVILVQFVSPFSFIKKKKGNAYLPNSKFLSQARGGELTGFLLPVNS